MPQSAPFPRVLTIAGSDSGGGAGIQADLKTFAALGAYGMSVITAITAQNTLGVQSVHLLPEHIIEAQYLSVSDDIRIDAVKIGMLPTAACVRSVAALLRRNPVPFIVLDPVLVATSGDALSVEDTVTPILTELMPLADITTPNLSELARLTNSRLAADEAEMLAQGRRLQQQGARALLLKGGHWANGDARDWLLDNTGTEYCISAPRIPTPHTHGTGCTLSAALAALHPVSPTLYDTVSTAKTYLQGAIETGSRWQLGHGHGPLAHGWQQACRSNTP